MKLFAALATALFLLNTPLALAADAAAGESATKPAATAPASARVNVNTADIMALTSLKGVGEKKAEAIIAYRKKNGPFSSLEQFEAVPGIGPAIVAKNKHLIVFR